MEEKKNDRKMDDWSLISWIKNGIFRVESGRIMWHVFHDFLCEVSAEWFWLVGRGDCILKPLLV